MNEWTLIKIKQNTRKIICERIFCCCFGRFALVKKQLLYDEESTDLYLKNMKFFVVEF